MENRKLKNTKTLQMPRLRLMPGLINPHQFRTRKMKKSNRPGPAYKKFLKILPDWNGRHAVDSGTSTSASVEEDAQNSDIDAAMSEMGDISLNENVLTALSATIDCTTIGDLVSDCTTFQSPTNERQRPTRVTDRPSRYKDSAF